MQSLTEGSISKNIWRLALPMMVSNSLQTVFSIAETLFVSRLGTDAIAAIGMSGSIMFVVMTLSIGLTFATMAMVARAVGAKDYDQAIYIATQSIIFNSVLAVILAAIGFLLSSHILKFMGVSDNVHQLALGYLRLMFMGVIPMFLFFLVNVIMQGSGDSLTPMKLSFISVGLNILIDPIFIFGLGVIPKFGLKGAAFAAIIARSFGLAMGLYILLKGKTILHIRFKKSRVDLDIIWRIIKIAGPGSMEMFIRSSAYLIFTKIVAIFGTFALAAYTVAARVDQVVLMPGFALGSAAGTLVGQNLGAQKPDRASKSAWTAAGNYAAFLSLMGFIFFILAPDLIRIFDKNPEVVKIGSRYLRVMAFAYVFIGFTIVMNRSLIGAGDAVPPMLFAAISLFGIQTPLALLLSRQVFKTDMGLWIAILAAMIIQATIATLWFARGKWKEKRV